MTCQHSFINQSNRNRGIKDRTTINIIITTNEISPLMSRKLKVGKNNIVVIILKNIIFIYSIKKSNANNPLPNSIFTPETNSLSPSAWSKGDRNVSDKIEIPQEIKIIKPKIITKGYLSQNFSMSNLITTTTGRKALKNIITS